MSLAAIRSLFGLTQLQVADYFRVSQSSVNKFEMGSQPLPTHGNDALKELVVRLPEMEALDGSGFEARFPVIEAQIELAFWRLKIDLARKGAAKVRRKIEQLDKNSVVTMESYSLPPSVSLP
jgi:transcriptional regulator with XRE-family HTH domain